MPEPDQPATPEEPAPVLDVHPPHEPIHGWRDFLVHILTITIGLLIALSLEGLVESLHHRHLLKEARGQIREEITHNRQTLAEDRRLLELGMEQTRNNLDLLDSRAPDPNRRLHLGWKWEGLDSAAWQTARDTGALGLMPYPEVQRFAGVYLQPGPPQFPNRRLHPGQNPPRHPASAQERADRERRGHCRALTRATRRDGQRLRRVLTQLTLMMDLLRGLDLEYTEALQQQP